MKSNMWTCISGVMLISTAIAGFAIHSNYEGKIDVKLGPFVFQTIGRPSSNNELTDGDAREVIDLSGPYCPPGYEVD